VQQPLGSAPDSPAFLAAEVERPGEVVEDRCCPVRPKVARPQRSDLRLAMYVRTIWLVTVQFYLAESATDPGMARIAAVDGWRHLQPPLRAVDLPDLDLHPSTQLDPVGARNRALGR
jgi:hypothetical protein